MVVNLYKRTQAMMNLMATVEKRTQQTLIVLMMRNVRNVMINWKNFLILERAGLKKEIGGQNACFAIGNGTVQNFAENKGEITGISFQKVDDHEGIVQAIFDSNNFSQVNWENAPTRNRQQDYFHLDEPVFAPI